MENVTYYFSVRMNTAMRVEEHNVINQITWN